MNKAADSLRKSSYGSKTNSKRNKGIGNAHEKIRPGTKSKVPATNEEIEQTDEELKGSQHKIDANKNGKIDGHDFKILRNAKKARYQ